MLWSSAPTRRTAAACTAALIVAALSACGSASNAPDAAQGGGSATAAAELSDASVRTLAAYTGGKPNTAADPKATPVVIGYLNQEGGGAGFPALTVQTKAAVKLVNEKLGGIDGHPVQLASCFITNAEEQGQTCGQQLANNGKLKLIVEGSLLNGADAFHAVIDPKKIPITGSFPLATSDATSSDSYYLSSGAFSTVPDYVKFVKDYLRQNQVSLIAVNGDPVSALVVRELKQGFGLAHVGVGSAAVPPNQTDATVALAAGGAQKSKVLIPFVIGTPQCLGIANTLKRSGMTGKTVLALDVCATPAVKRQFGDLPKWTYASSYVDGTTTGGDAREQTEQKAYKQWYDQLGADGRELTGAPALQSLLTAVKFVTEAGGAKATTAEVAATAKAFKGPILLGPPTVGYGKLPVFPALPNLGLRFFTYGGDGKWTDATGGQWVEGVLGGG
jgi:branched-chain amino acid transport system substrate-binding protein